jgi:hypothetical protein
MARAREYCQRPRSSGSRTKSNLSSLRSYRPCHPERSEGSAPVAPMDAYQLRAGSERPVLRSFSVGGSEGSALVTFDILGGRSLVAALAPSP